MKGLNTSVRRATLVVLTCSVLLTPTYAFSADRDGTVIYFTFEDLKQLFSHSSLPALPQVFPVFSWRDQREPTGQQRLLERNYWWGNGQGDNGFPLPETRPGWGYSSQNTK